AKAHDGSDQVVSPFSLEVGAHEEQPQAIPPTATLPSEGGGRWLEHLQVNAGPYHRNPVGRNRVVVHQRIGGPAGEWGKQTGARERAPVDRGLELLDRASLFAVAVSRRQAVEVPGRGVERDHAGDAPH